MKVIQSAVLPPSLTGELVKLGEQLGRLRHAHRISQGDAAIRAGISRNTAYRIECGHPGVAIGQIVRYLDAIAPGATFQDLVNETSEKLVALKLREMTKRTRTVGGADRLTLSPKLKR